MLGALVFVALVAMSIVSISGRKLFSAPVPGDVELLQLCAAFASSSFFAWCHLNHGDVKVDFFTERLPERAVHALDAVGSALVAAFGALLAWRTGAGVASVHAASETTDPRPAAVGGAGADAAGLRAAGAGRALSQRRTSAAHAPRPAAGRGQRRRAMSGIAAGLVLFGVMLVLLVLRVPIGIAMFSVAPAATSRG